MFDLNQLAVEIARREGGKKPQSIAQIKETLRCLRDVLHTQTLPEAMFILGRIIERKKRK